MSYSRWIDSMWYTFWRSPKATCRNEEVFTVCNLADFTYRDLKDKKDDCLSSCRKYAEDHYVNGCTEEDVAELSGYMDLFIEHVEFEYPKGAKS